jgi:hypothetical protein
MPSLPNLDGREVTSPCSRHSGFGPSHGEGFDGRFQMPFWLVALKEPRQVKRTGYRSDKKPKAVFPHSRSDVDLEFESPQPQVGFKVPEALFNWHPLLVEADDPIGVQKITEGHRNKQVPGSLISGLVINDHVDRNLTVGVVENIFVTEGLLRQSFSLSSFHAPSLVSDDRLLLNPMDIGPL